MYLLLSSFYQSVLYQQCYYTHLSLGFPTTVANNSEVSTDVKLEWLKQVFSYSDWSCLLNKPQWENATVVPSTIKYQYSLEDQCRMEFGEGWVTHYFHDLFLWKYPILWTLPVFMFFYSYTFPVSVSRPTHLCLLISSLICFPACLSVSTLQWPLVSASIHHSVLSCVKPIFFRRPCFLTLICFFLLRESYIFACIFLYMILHLPSWCTCL